MNAPPVREYRSYGLIGRAWAGVEPLWLAYWVYGVLGGNLIGYGIGKAANALPPYVVLFLLLLTIPYYVWVNVSVWRCAANSHPLWWFLARVSVVLGIAISVWNIWRGIHGNAY